MGLGICLSGVEEEFERALRERAVRGMPFVYLECGTANADTWINVCHVLRTTGAQWRTIGVDPSVYAYENYQKKIEPQFGIERALMLVHTREEAFEKEKVRIGNRLDFVFIDGCHTKRCVMGDFLAVEPLVVSGGLVVFHDFDLLDKGEQTHCGMGAKAGVVEATAELGLYGGNRPGWKRLPNWIADASKNGADCGVFEKL